MAMQLLAGDVLREIEQVDREIVGLLARRRALAGELPADRSPGSTFPVAFRVADVVRLYSDGLGAPGELVARAVLNTSRAAQSGHA